MPPSIFDPPPAYVQQDLDRLSVYLDDEVPDKVTDQNILIATWNIQKFGNLTKKWTATSNDSPKRDYHSLLCIKNIIERFDVIAVQEVMANLRALRYMIKLLGSEWGFLMTDVNYGDKGNDERLAFIYNTTRVRPSGLCCELVIPEEEGDISANAFQHQFVRTPYAASFICSGQTIILTTLHVYYGDDADDRTLEMQAIAKWRAKWAKREKAWGHNFLLLGDFNIDRIGDPLYDAFVATGLHTPSKLNDVPRTIYTRPDEPETEKHYDQIAWFNGANNIPKLNIEYIDAGSVDFVGLVKKNLSMRSLGFRISDHFPLWAEFRIDN